ncbi:hypothetical protein [Paenibacillus sp. 453mf]|uniref:hypothetical protein n=1 Tax=Paenibacillus sp. 453mf TaxID=1761874 RepID=UPI00147D13AC|nr:hypothetical protein [Paenibacillus sp. 453mf]
MLFELTSVQIYEDLHEEWLNDFYKLNQVKTADRMTISGYMTSRPMPDIAIGI